MNKAIAILGASLVAAMTFTAPAHAFFFKKQNQTPDVQLASLDQSTKSGWMQVLTDDKPVKKTKKTKFDVNASPVQRKLVA